MSHKDVLKQLMPLDAGSVFTADLEREGVLLDAAQDSAEGLLAETLPTGSYAVLGNWERLTGVASAVDSPLQSRREKVVRRLRELGDIKKPYFEALAASYGYQIYIQEYLPTMSGWAGAGDELIPDDPAVLFVWNAHILGQGLYPFRAGQSAAGESLLWWRPAEELEALLNDLRPAHVLFIFSYD